MSQDKGRVVRGGEQPEVTLRRLQDTLRDTRRRVGRIDDRKTRDELTNLLEDAEALARSLELPLRQSSSSARDREANRDELANVMDPPAFRRLVDTVRRYSFDSERTTTLKTAARTANFTCDQVREFLRLFEWDAERRRALVALYPRIVDKRNITILADTFDWSAEWRSVCRELGISG